MAIFLSPIDWIDRSPNSLYSFQVISGAAKPQLPWAGDVSKAPIASYVRTMLFDDYTVTGTVETPASDDIPILFLRANNSGSVLLAAYNNNTWSIYSSVSPYASFTATLDLKAASVAVQSYGDGAVISFSAQGNTYIASLNGTEVVRWVDQRGDWAANVNSAHHEFAMSYLCSTVQGGWDSISADDLYIWPMLVGSTGSGTLSAPTPTAVYARSPALSGVGTVSATAFASYASTPALSGGGTLSATASRVPVPTITNITTSPFHIGDTLTLTGTGYTGTVTVTVGGVAATSVNVTSSTSLTCVVPSVALGAQNVVVTTASGASSAYSITLVFPAFNETNTARTNQTVPANTSGAWVTLIGAGGGGGRGFYHGSQARGGGGGGGGAGKVERVFCPVASLGATYSVVRPLGGSDGAAGAAATFISGSVSLSGGGGGGGGNGTTSTAGTAGAAGTATASGVTATLRNGTAGALGGAPAGGNGANAVNNTTGGGPGGGGGAGFSSLGSPGTGGSGGNSATVNGGAVKAISTGGTGNNGTNGAAGNAGGGGGGSSNIAGGNNNGTTGGLGGEYGAGAGGGMGGTNTGSPSAGAQGGDSWTLIEWV